MVKFGEKHPIVFEIILVVIAFLAAAAVVAAGNMANVHPDLTSSVARICIGVVLLIIYRRAFAGRNFTKGLVIVLPALLFAAWNIFYNLSSGMVFGGPIFFVEALITASAPAIFEEVLFRGIFIHNLKQQNCSDLKCLFITAIVFALMHLTNLVGLDIISVALQFVYSFVIGLALAAIYLRNNSILQVIIVHFLIDYTNRLFVEQASSASYTQLAIFIVLLIAEAIYAIMLVSRKKDTEEIK